jgi:predicted dehydrogenase
MRKLRFCLIGDGSIARYHKNAIEHVGGELSRVIDIKYESGIYLSKSHTTCSISLEHTLVHNLEHIDFFVISTPSNLHREQIKYILHNFHAMIICEKPAFLPWEQTIDSDSVNIVLQLRYLPGLPKKADLVKAVFVRDENYFKTWKGDARKTGGIFYNLFIHYIDLAIQLGADFEGMVKAEGEQDRHILYTRENHDGTSVMFLDQDSYQVCYNRMYEDIVSGGGIKPSDLFYLNWVLQRNSELFGFGRNGMNKLIRIGKELL